MKNEQRMMERKREPQSSGNREAIADAVAKRAFQLFLARGGEHGHDLDDWLAAEEEFREQVPTRRP